MNTTTTQIAGEAMTDDTAAFEAAFKASHEYPEQADQLEFRKGWEARALLESKPAVPLEAELASMTRMFHAACSDLGLVNEALGLDPDDGGAAPILEAIAELKSARDQWVDANYTAPAQSCGDAEQADEAVTLPTIPAIPMTQDELNELPDWIKNARPPEAV